MNFLFMYLEHLAANTFMNFIKKECLSGMDLHGKLPKLLCLQYLSDTCIVITNPEYLIKKLLCEK